MLNVIYSGQFKKDYKRCQKRGLKQVAYKENQSWQQFIPFLFREGFFYLFNWLQFVTGCKPSKDLHIFLMDKWGSLLKPKLDSIIFSWNITYFTF